MGRTHSGGKCPAFVRGVIRLSALIPENIKRKPFSVWISITFFQKELFQSFIKGKLNKASHQSVLASDNIRVTWVDDSQCAHSVVFPTRCAQFNIIATVVMDTGFSQHGIVFYFRFPWGTTTKSQRKSHTKVLTALL